jgi:hypothetical protein
MATRMFGGRLAILAGILVAGAAIRAEDRLSPSPSPAVTPVDIVRTRFTPEPLSTDTGTEASSDGGPHLGTGSVVSWFHGLPAYFPHHSSGAALPSENLRPVVTSLPPTAAYPAPYGTLTGTPINNPYSSYSPIGPPVEWVPFTPPDSHPHLWRGPVVTWARRCVSCWSHHNLYGCSSCTAQATFLFGSCRDYFGDPCRKAPPPLLAPAGYAGLQPGGYGGLQPAGYKGLQANTCPTCAGP